MKKVLVIGATGGIGKITAELLQKEGYEVIGTGFNDFKEGGLLKFKVDIGDVESIKGLAKSLDGQPLYAIVNCAGIVKYEEEGIDKDIEIWKETIEVNLSSNFYLAKLFQKNLQENGRFVMISSTDSFFGGTITASYSASKAGVNSLTKSLSLIFKDKKIRVNAIAPGWVSTPMIAGSSEAFYKKLAETNPLGRIAEPEDIAKVVKFLLSKDSDYVNGQVITVDGSYTNQDITLLIEEEEVK